MQRPRVLKGQSLIEIMLAITVFLFGVVTIGVRYLECERIATKSLDSAKSECACRRRHRSDSLHARPFVTLVTTGTHGLLISDDVTDILIDKATRRRDLRRTVLMSAPVYKHAICYIDRQLAFQPFSHRNRGLNKCYCRLATRVSKRHGRIRKSIVEHLTNVCSKRVDVMELPLRDNSAQCRRNRTANLRYFKSNIPVYRGGTETGMNLFVLDACDNRVYIAGDSKPAETKIIDVESDESFFTRSDRSNDGE